MAKTKPPEFWAKVQADFEAGTSKAELSRIYDVTTNAITYRQKKEGWEVKPQVEEPEATVNPEVETSTVEADVEWEDPVEGPPPVADDREALLARIGELEQKLAAAEREAAELSPTTHVDLPKSAADVLEFHDRDTLVELVQLRLAAENMDRFKKGMPPLDFQNNPQVLEQKIAEYAQKRAAARNRPPSEIHRQRVIKMIRPDGNIVQWPVEEQISNEAGQAGAAIWKAREKGWKLVEPYICQVRDCWQEAATNDFGELSLDGYCSPEHRLLDPYLNSQPVPGVATSKAARF